MFAPDAGVVEDQVCGSANCLSAPYWAEKHGFTSNDTMHVKSVSKRGGDLFISVDRERHKVVIRGEVKEVADGHLY